jgi:hypothetical protein
VILSGAVEGVTDEAVLGRLIRHVGADVSTVYGRSGKHNLLARLAGFNEAARHAPWLVLVDLDHDYPCAPDALAIWLPAPSTWMCLRVPVREVESWLLADRPSLASYLGVRQTAIPADPDDLSDPKQALVNAARTSRRRAIREEVVPRPGSGREVGAGYVGHVIQFATSHWEPDIAAAVSPSLMRCLNALRALVARPCP